MYRLLSTCTLFALFVSTASAQSIVDKIDSTTRLDSAVRQWLRDDNVFEQNGIVALFAIRQENCSSCLATEVNRYIRDLPDSVEAIVILEAPSSRAVVATRKFFKTSNVLSMRTDQLSSLIGGISVGGDLLLVGEGGIVNQRVSNLRDNYSSDWLSKDSFDEGVTVVESDTIVVMDIASPMLDEEGDVISFIDDKQNSIMWTNINTGRTEYYPPMDSTFLETFHRPDHEPEAWKVLRDFSSTLCTVERLLSIGNGRVVFLNDMYVDVYPDPSVENQYRFKRGNVVAELSNGRYKAIKVLEEIKGLSIMKKWVATSDGSIVSLALSPDQLTGKITNEALDRSTPALVQWDPNTGAAIRLVPVSLLDSALGTPYNPRYIGFLTPLAHTDGVIMYSNGNTSLFLLDFTPNAPTSVNNLNWEIGMPVPDSADWEVRDITSVGDDVVSLLRVEYDSSHVKWYIRFADKSGTIARIKEVWSDAPGGTTDGRLVSNASGDVAGLRRDRDGRWIAYRLLR